MMMRRFFLCSLLLVLACEDPVPGSEARDCGVGVPCRDAAPCEGGPCGLEGRLDGGLAERLDAELDSSDAAAPVADMRVCPPVEAPLQPRNGLADLVLRRTLSTGGPVGPEAIIVTNLDGDPEGTLEVVLARGGRVEALDVAGNDWWRTAVVDAQRIVGAPDLDGDGRREIVVAAGADVLVLDGLTGQMRWQLPDRPLGPDRVLTAVHRVLITDLDDDDLPDLYVTDVGCGGVGTGRGAVFSFAAGFGTRIGVIDGPRLNGRCTRWNTAVDVDGDGRRELVLTDGRGLNVFDVRSGDQQACGDLEDLDTRGILPHIAIGSGTGAWFVFTREGVVRVQWGPDRADRCAGTHTLDSLWRSPDAVTSTGSFTWDMDGDDVIDLVTSRWSSADGVWQVVWLDGIDGATHVLAADARLRGPVRFEGEAPPLLLVRVGDGESPNRFGTLQLLDLQGAGVWAASIAASTAVRGRVKDHASTAEFTPLLHLPTDDGARLILLSGESADDTLPRRLSVVGPRGVLATRPLEGMPGFVGGACVTGPSCHPATPVDRLVVTRGDGRIGLLDGALLLRNPDPLRLDVPRPSRPVGASRVVVGQTGENRRVVALSAAGLLSALDPNAEDDGLIWQSAIGLPRNGTPGLRALDIDGVGGVFLRDPRAGEAAWSAFSMVDGTLRWQHRLDAERHVVMRPMVVGGEGRDTWVARMDRLVPGVPLSPDPSCPADLIREDDLWAPDPECPGIEILPRLITALNAIDGRCRWRRILRPIYPCSGPANQALSVADGDGDGRFELYVTETNGIHRLDPTSGESTGIRPLGRGETGALRGGGWIRSSARPPMVIWTGGNAPIEALDETLATRWSAVHPPDLRLQSWIGRDVVTLPNGVWVVPGRGWPLQRHELDTGRVDLRVGFTAGRAVLDAVAAPEYVNVDSMRGVTDVDGRGTDGLLVATDDGFLFGLNAEGEVVWVRAHDTAIGAPIVTQLDGAGLREMVVPAGDGRVLIYGEPGPPPPVSVWDLPCPAINTCTPDDDIDESTDTTRFCGAWTPLANVDGYEARVLGPNGAIIRDWSAFATPSATFNGLRLVPGLRYALEVRVLVAAEGRPTRSTGRVSDGVLIVDDGAPRVVVEVAPDALAPGTAPAIVTVRASDEDRLAGWHLDVIDSVSSGLAVRLASAALNQPFFEGTYSWDTTDRDKHPLRPGQYRVRAEFTDRAGNTGAGEALLTVCDGPCP